MKNTKPSTGWMSKETRNAFEAVCNCKASKRPRLRTLFIACLVVSIFWATGFAIYISELSANSTEYTAYHNEYTQSYVVEMPEPVLYDYEYCDSYEEEQEYSPVAEYALVFPYTYYHNPVAIGAIMHYENKLEPEPELEAQPEPVQVVPVLQAPVPQARCYFKSWMDWRAITARNSRQWRLQQIAYTCDDGFRRVDGMYMIALGTYFLYHGVGDVFDITLSSGVTFRAIVGDVKSDLHTDPTNRFHLSDGSMVEFLVDRQVMCSSILSMGNISVAGFPGNVVSIDRVPELFVAV